jgi:hypothetical protein
MTGIMMLPPPSPMTPLKTPTTTPKTMRSTGVFKRASRNGVCCGWVELTRRGRQRRTG